MPPIELAELEMSVGMLLVVIIPEILSVSSVTATATQQQTKRPASTTKCSEGVGSIFFPWLHKKLQIKGLRISSRVVRQ